MQDEGLSLKPFKLRAFLIDINLRRCDSYSAQLTVSISSAFPENPR